VTATLDFPNHSAAPESALGLLAQAELGLTAAELEDHPAERFAAAYLAALRGAAALLALRGRPHRGRARPMSVWTLLSSVAPELREWAAFFASCSATRASVQAGITRAVSTRSADDLVRQADQFLELVARMTRHSDARDQ
jgi:HEPN superfamily protein